MMAQKSPKVEKKPISDWLIIANPVMSETADPKSAMPEAPPTASIDFIVLAPFSFSSLNRSMTWIT